MGEAEIIDGLIKRNEKIFRDFVDQYHQMVVNTCIGFVHSVEDAEDIAQEVFIEVYRSIQKFRGSSKLSTWLYRIAVNRSLNFLRDNRKHSWFRSFDEEIKTKIEKLHQTITGNNDNPEFILENKQRSIVLHEAINSLPENQRVVFILNKYEDLGNKEIAEVMNLSVSAVESLIHRAKKNLQKKLYHYYKNKCI